MSGDELGKKPEEKGYELAPEEPKPVAPPQPEAPIAKPLLDKPQLDRPSLLEGFDEDADFDKDPEAREAERSQRVGTKRTRTVPEKPAREVKEPDESLEEEPEDGPGPLVRKGLKGLQIYAGIGGGILLAAVILSIVNAPANGVAWGVRTLYDASVHTVLGLWACWLLAKIEGRKLGDWPQAAARLFLCVAVFQFMLSINLVWKGGKIDEAIVGAGLYAVGMKFLLKWSWQRVAHVGMLQFAMWAVIEIGMAIDRWASSMPANA